MIPGNINTDLISGADEVGYQVTRSLRFNSADSAYLSRTPASAGNRKTWTWAGWVKRSKLSTFTVLFEGAVDYNDQITRITFESNNKLEVLFYDGYAVVGRKTTDAVFRDCSAWYHILVAVDTTQATAANRIRVYVNGSEVTSFSSTTNPSQNYDTYVNATNGHRINTETNSPGGFSDFYAADYHLIDGQALDPSSFVETSATTGQLIPKRYTGSFGTNGFWLKFSDNSTATATTLGKDYSGNNNNWTPNNLSVYQATSIRWSSTYPLYSGTPYLAFDGSTSTVVQLQTGGSLTVNFAPGIPVSSSVGLYTESSTYISGARINGGTTVSNPNGSTGNWTIPFSGIMTSIEVFSTGTGAAQNWYRTQVDGANLIIPVGGASVNDSLVDTPTSYGTDTGAGGEVRGNYCTWNPLSAKNTSTVFSNGNLDLNTAPVSNHGHCGATIAVSSGKWYWEITKNTNTAAVATGLGVGRTDLIPNPNSAWFGNGAGKNYVYLQGSTVYMYDGTSSGSATSTSVVNDAGTFMFALDLDNSKFWVGKNGTWFSWNSVTGGNPSTGVNPTFSSFTAGASYTPVVNTYEVGNTLSANFGQRPFAYTAPSGFKALCDTNLPAPVVAKPSEVMTAVTWTGNGTDNRVISTGFAPDLVWVKCRSSTISHLLADSVRGGGNILYSNLTDAENGQGYNTNQIQAFTSSGFELGDDSWVNWSTGASYVGWAWDAGSSTVTNTQGSITSQVRANPSAGFSIVTYTGTGSAGTVGHGLNAAPSMIILKNRDTTANWLVYHSSRKDGYNPQQNMLYLSSTGVGGTGNTYPWNNTAPTSTVFSIGGGDYGQITNGSKIVAYCFAPVAGYSSFGSYTGNGSADGPFVYTGFRPRWLLIKQSSASGENWIIYDAAREPANVAKTQLFPNLSNGEFVSGTSPNGHVDILSNGFKCRETTSGTNGSGATYVYACFAESPFQYARAR